MNFVSSLYSAFLNLDFYIYSLVDYVLTLSNNLRSIEWDEKMIMNGGQVSNWKSAIVACEVTTAAS
jgi:hypothetical protein